MTEPIETLAARVAEIHRLEDAVRGPTGFATWQDAAVDAHQRRVAAEAELAASVAAPSVNDELLARARQICANAHDMILRGADDTEICELLEEGYGLGANSAKALQELADQAQEMGMYEPAPLKVPNSEVLHALWCKGQSTDFRADLRAFSELLLAEVQKGGE